MAFKFVVFAAALAYANAGLLAAPEVAHYSSAPAVSTSYIHQSSGPVAAHAAPIVSAYGAPVVSSYAHSAPLAVAHSAPLAVAHSAPLAVAHSVPLTVAHASPVAIHTPAIGSTQQSVVRSLGGLGAVSHYSKAVDTAFSSVRKYDTRITNDALTVAHTPVAVAHHSPLAVAHASPVVSAYSSPVATYAHSAPIVTKTAAISYSPAAVVSHATFSGHGAAYQW